MASSLLAYWRSHAKWARGSGAHRHRPHTAPTLEALESRYLLNGIPIIPNLPSTFLSVSTIPGNGDLNPYGVAFVPNGFPPGGPLHAGDVLVSNFNNSGNLQGTGTTIVDISPTGQQTLFFQGPSTPGALGLTTALGVLSSGFVIVGSVPTLDGTSGTIQAPGSLLILNRHGKVVTTLRSSALLDGPWDLTINDQGSRAQVFVSNVLSGTVTRIDLAIHGEGNVAVTSEVQIASGYVTHPDPAALIVGPTGLAYDAANDLLYVASTGDNAIFAIKNAGSRTTDAGTGSVIYADATRLHGPLALTLTPNGDLITSNGDAPTVTSEQPQPSELIEFTPGGQFVAELSVDSAAGSAFGLAVESSPSQIHFAAVDDNLNTLDIWTINLAGGAARLPNSQSGQIILGPLSSALRPDATTVSPADTATPEGGHLLTPVSSEAAVLDQLFAGTAKESPLLSLSSPNLPAHHGAENVNVDILADAM